MKRKRMAYFLILSALGGSLSAGQSEAAKHSTNTHAAPARPALPGGSIEPGARVIQYGPKDVVTLKAKLRFTTLIVLPKDERILDFACGDKDLWVVNGAENMAYVKAAKAGAETNLNLVTASGNIYSFVLREISESTQAEPDLKVFIEPKEESMVSAISAAPRFVSSLAVEDYRQQVTLAKEETRQVKQASQAAIDSGISKFLANMRFPYRFEAGKKPFNVRAMYHDDKFTYLQARPEETPALYELQDGKPNLVDFDYRDGLYVVPKILDRGYLAIGKQRLNFTRDE